MLVGLAGVTSTRFGKGETDSPDDGTGSHREACKAAWRRGPGANTLPSSVRQRPSPYTAREDASRMCAGRTPWRVKASNICEVPTTLTVAWRVASVSDWPVPVSAARWTTVSGRTNRKTVSQFVAFATSIGSRSTLAGSRRGRPGAVWTCGCRTSTTTTFAPEPTSFSESAQPMNPAPPVIKTSEDIRWFPLLIGSICCHDGWCLVHLAVRPDQPPYRLPKSPDGFRDLP